MLHSSSVGRFLYPIATFATLALANPNLGPENPTSGMVRLVCAQRFRLDLDLDDGSLTICERGEKDAGFEFSGYYIRSRRLSDSKNSYILPGPSDKWILMNHEHHNEQKELIARWVLRPGSINSRVICTLRDENKGCGAK